LKDLVAKISLKNDETEITNIVLHIRRLRFKCQNCASLCCKLGGPPLSQKDIKQIEGLGYDLSEFSEPASFKQSKLSKTMQNMMRNREDGSCVFLKIDEEEGNYKCSIYERRPALCRLYPFYIEKADSRLLLKVILCCKGLNNPDGELVNEEFILRNFNKTIVDLLRDTFYIQSRK